MQKNTQKPEILAPAGSIDAFYAALAGGADAVYLGGTAFNARASAKNFTNDLIYRALYMAHEKGKKVYITLNTLAGDLEIPKAAEFAYELHCMGADAFIVQDAGLGMYLKECIPDITLHASTQMAVHNAQGVNFLADKGFERVVICREASREDLKILTAQTETEIEMFVHGAICVCRSGQCLMSSFIGRRSGNRGECAQPCRLNYNGKASLSIPDMCLARHIPEICGMGIASLKIEGRMKSPEYVFGVSRVYRRLVDECRSATADEVRQLKELFSRGFTDGYYDGRRVMTGAVRSERDKELTRRAEGALSGMLSDKTREMRNMSVPEMPEIPPFSPPRPPKNARGMKKIKKAGALGLRIVFCEGSVYSQRLLEEIEKLDYGEKYLEGIYFPLNSKLPRAKDIYGVITPHAVQDTQRTDFVRMLQNGTTLGYKKCLVRNVSHISDVENADYLAGGAMELNVYNSESVKAFREMGFESVTLSAECTLPQIRDIDKYKIPCAVTVYGRLPLMVTSVCQMNPNGCEHCGKACSRKTALTDRTGAKFPVYADGMGHNIIYNSLNLCGADKLKALYDCGVSTAVLMFTDENENQIISIIKSFIKGENPTAEFTRGYLK